MEIEGLIIRQTQFQDNDMMITLLSNERMYSFLARGVMKLDSKNASAVNMFNYGRYVLMSGKKGKTLKTGEILNSFANTHKNFDTLASLDFLSEVTNKLIADDNCSLIYEYLLKSLELLDGGFDALTVDLIYLAALLRESGYGLNVDECINCHQTSQISTISYEDGGFICLDCFDPFKHKKSDIRKLKIIRYIFKVKPEQMGRVEFEKNEVIDILNELVTFASNTADLNLKSLDLLKKV